MTTKFILICDSITLVCFIGIIILSIIMAREHKKYNALYDEMHQRRMKMFRLIQEIKHYSQTEDTSVNVEELEKEYEQNLQEYKDLLAKALKKI